MAPSPTHVLKPGVVLHSFLFLTTAPQPPVYLTYQPVPLNQSSKKKKQNINLPSPLHLPSVTTLVQVTNHLSKTGNWAKSSLLHGTQHSNSSEF